MSSRLQDVYGTSQKQVGVRLNFLDDTMSKSGETLPRVPKVDQQDDSVHGAAPVTASRGSFEGGGQAAVPAAKPVRTLERLGARGA